MKRAIYWLIFLVILLHYYPVAQNGIPAIKWEKSFGGSNLDLAGGLDPTTAPAYLRTFIADRDGGYIVAGITNSNDNDISGNHGLSDIWIAKLDSAKNIIWSKCLGGSNEDYIYSLILDNDGNIIIGGATRSTDGDVTDNHGGGDAWVVKLDRIGNIIWKKCYGGSSAEFGNQIQVVGEQGYIFVTTSYSSNGDVSGTHGNGDIWIVRLDVSGNILWQKNLGGSGIDVDQSVITTSDSGFIILAEVRAIDGDIQAGQLFNGGGSDFWIVKLSSTGVLQWQKVFGGSGDDHPGSITQSIDGGYLVTGTTNSSNLFQLKGAIDACIVKLDGNGNVQWQKNFGGSKNDVFSDLIVLPDKSYLAFGTTESSNGDVSANHGKSDYWTVKINETGNILWEKTFGGSNEDAGAVITPSSGDIFYLTGLSRSSDKDVSVNYGNGDIWIVEIGAVNFIVGYIFNDFNSNGIKDAGETDFNLGRVVSEKGVGVWSTIPSKGFYRINIDTGTFVTKAIPTHNYYTAVPVSGTSSFSSYFNTDTINFAIQPIPGKQDVTVNIIPLSAVRPGFILRYKIVYTNIGTEAISSGNIKLVIDNRFIFQGATPAQTDQLMNTITWDFANLLPSDAASIIVTLTSSAATTHIGDTLQSVATISPVSGDLTPLNNTAILRQLLTGSYDPNDKTEANAGIITPAQVNDGDYLNYLIRFQNTGTDTAFTVYVRDTLSAKLDWNSFEMVNASHAYNLQIADGDKLTWTFNDIKLADSFINEPASHGYIAYRIKPKPTVVLGDTIHNTASIYFDFNLPVETNNAFTLVMNNVALPVNLSAFNAKLNGHVVDVSWKTASESNVKQFEVQRSLNGVDYVTIGIVKAKNAANGASYAYTDNNPVNGYNYYRLKSVDADESAKLSAIVIVNVNSEVNIVSAVYPNPTTGSVILRLQGKINGNVRLQVMDQFGRELLSKQYGQQNTSQLQSTLELGKLSKGNYILRVYVGDKVYLHKVVIQ